MEFTEPSALTIYLSVALAVTLALSFIVSCSETALFSIIRTSSSQGDDSVSSRVKDLISDTDYLAYTLLLIGNLLNIAVIFLSNSLINTFVEFSGSGAEIAIKIAVIGVLLLIFAVFIPKSLAAYNPEHYAQSFAPFIQAFGRVLKPLTWLFMKVGGKITISSSVAHNNMSVEQLQNAVEVAGSESSDDEQKMLTGIVTFIGREVITIMKPRVDVVAIESSLDFHEVMEVIRGSNYSRLPVYDNNFDEIVGLLFAKDLLPYLDESADFEWQKLLRDPYFVPENKKINDLLEDFQAKKRHLAIVVDEYGGTLGIVTLEDILEEVVGEISDETDATSTFYKQLSPNTYLFEGSVHLNDFSEVLGLEDEEVEQSKGNADTLAGLMMEIKGEFFKEGDEILFGDLTLKACKVERYRITEVLVTRKSNES